MLQSRSILERARGCSAATILNYQITRGRGREKDSSFDSPIYDARSIQIQSGTRSECEKEGEKRVPKGCRTENWERRNEKRLFSMTAEIEMGGEERARIYPGLSLVLKISCFRV